MLHGVFVREEKAYRNIPTELSMSMLR